MSPPVSPAGCRTVHVRVRPDRRRPFVERPAVRAPGTHAGAKPAIPARDTAVIALFGRCYAHLGEARSDTRTAIMSKTLQTQKNCHGVAWDHVSGNRTLRGILTSVGGAYRSYM
jgi:hypothetical protein